jgi:hypothetical protein
MPAFALTIFTGAFLLFQVQPLIGKYILPWFGGSPGVWTTCMLFFQMLLLGGYAYAHATSRYLKPRTQAIVHVVLIGAALATLPITPGDSWKPQGAGDPTWHILALLGASLGLPYFVLAATGPLMQEWFRRTTPGVSPYRLYALSNVGSLLALVSYPFYFETNFTRQAQAQLWSWGLGFYALCGGYCAYRVWRTPAPAPAAAGASAAEMVAARPTPGQRVLWVCLPACASILLLAVTNKMCQDVAVIPFLWVLPLALYLLSFIICFDSPRWYSRFCYTIALAGAMVAISVALFEGADMPIVRQVVIYAATLFIGCMVCHGELYRLKPHPAQLTSYYLLIASGGAVGGLFVALVAPYVFNNFHEMHLSLALTVLLLLVISLRGKDALSPRRWAVLFAILAAAAVYGAGQGIALGGGWLRQHPVDSLAWLQTWGDWLARFPWLVWLAAGLLAVVVGFRRRRLAQPLNWHGLACSLLGAGWLTLVVVLAVQIWEAGRGALLSSRNFYGVQSVVTYRDEEPEWRYLVLQHGRITHGLQFTAPERAPMITSYFGPNTGLGLALRHFPRQQNQRIGLLGLGVGSIAAYGKPGDYLRIYEINPQVKEIAENPFSYIALSKAKIDIVMGDGRLSLENEPPQNFDFLIMDAFSSDAVPVHLLTKEAFAIYQRHLKPDGAILVNISNRYLDLRPVVENAARAFGLDSHHINNDPDAHEEDDGGWWLYGSTWMVLSRNQEFMSRNALRDVASPPLTKPNTIPLWTDDYASMFRILQ